MRTGAALRALADVSEGPTCHDELNARSTELLCDLVEAALRLELSSDFALLHARVEGLRDLVADLEQDLFDIDADEDPVMADCLAERLAETEVSLANAEHELSLIR